MVNFVVDTGSNYTALSEKEAQLMGLDYTFLPEARANSVGFGGAFKTRIINSPVYMTFGSDNQKYKHTFGSGLKIICIPPEKTQKEREALLKFTPSVLGMDILCEFELRMNKKRFELILDK